MIRAACDASMDHPHGITAVAGYIASADDWKPVEEKWTTLLTIKDLARFRTTEIIERYGWERGLECLNEFADIIEESELRHVTAHMLDTDWALLDKDSEYLKVYPERQHACLGMVLNALASEMRAPFSGKPIAVVFDNDYGNTAKAAAVYEEWRARTGHPGFDHIGFTKGTAEWEVVPLQCADLAAWVVRREPMSKDMLKSREDRSDMIWSKDPLHKLSLKVLGNGSGAFWSIAMAREVEALKKRYPSSAAGFSSVTTL